MVYASFVLAEIGSGHFAAVVNNHGRLGCPGGHVEQDEHARPAAIREAEEEGWYIHTVEKQPFFKKTMNGKQYWWYRGYGAHKLEEFVEKGKDFPEVVSWGELAKSGMGNDQMLAEYYRLRYES